MIDPNEMPASLVERATLMQNLLIARATGLSADSEVYEALRREFMSNETLNQLLPDFVRTCRSLDVFWPHIQSKSGKYAERRHIIGTAFNALFDYLEQRHRAPVDAAASETLQTFDATGVHAALGLYTWLVLKPLWRRIGGFVLPLLFAIPVVAVSFGYTSIAPDQLGADRLIDHFDELPAALAEL